MPDEINKLVKLSYSNIFEAITDDSEEALLMKQEADSKLQEREENEHSTEIKLTNEQFDQFILSCERPWPVSPKIMAAAKELDEKGLVFHVRKLD